jgi:putative alpha-1,2-mannosidase
MSAWFVISTLGLYAVDPVSTCYDFGTPLFDRVEVDLAGGRRLVIEAKRESPKALYIESAEWNGHAVGGLSVEHAQLMKGGTLVFYLKNEPTSTA